MSAWKDIGTLLPDDGSLVAVRRIPTNAPPFSAHWAPAVAGGAFLCGPERWFLPWWRVFDWRYISTPITWPSRGSAARSRHDTFLDPPSDSQHVQLYRDWPSLGVLHAVWDRGAFLYRIQNNSLSLPWWAAHSWKRYGS
jgi:hypothetical protein